MYCRAALALTWDSDIVSYLGYLLSLHVSFDVEQVFPACGTWEGVKGGTSFSWISFFFWFQNKTYYNNFIEIGMISNFVFFWGPNKDENGFRFFPTHLIFLITTIHVCLVVPNSKIFGFTGTEKDILGWEPLM